MALKYGLLVSRTFAALRPSKSNVSDRIRYATHGNVSHKYIRKRCFNIRPIEAVVRTNKLQWLGHVIRMDDSRLPKKLLFARPDNATRPKGRPITNWRQSITNDLKSIYQLDTCIASAKNRPAWRRIIHKSPKQLRSDRSSRLRLSTRLQRRWVFMTRWEEQVDYNAEYRLKVKKSK